MKIPRPIPILAGCLILTAAASAQVSLAPPATETPAAGKPAAKPKAKSPVIARKPAAPVAAPQPEAAPVAPTATVTPAPVPDDPHVDDVYAAYQRGQYKTAFNLATQRVQDNPTPRP